LECGPHPVAAFAEDPAMIGLIAALLTTPSADEISKHLLPKDTERLAVVNFAVIRDSGYWTEDISQGFERGMRDNEQFERVAKLLEIEPKHLEKFTICETNQGRGPERVLFIVNGEFPLEKASKGLEDMSKAGELTALTIHDQPVYYNHRARDASYFALLDEHTIIVSPAKRLVEDALEGLKELREPKPEVSDRLNLQQSSEFAVRLAGVIPDEAKAGLARVPQFVEIADKVKAYDVVGTLGENPRLQVKFTMEDSASATKGVGVLNGLVAFAKLTGGAAPRPDLIALLDKLSIRANDAEIVADISITSQQMADMVSENRKDREKWEARMKERREKMRRERGDRPKDSRPASEPPPRKDG
jgi:hypothetical protein